MDLIHIKNLDVEDAFPCLMSPCTEVISCWDLVIVREASLPDFFSVVLFHPCSFPWLEKNDLHSIYSCCELHPCNSPFLYPLLYLFPVTTFNSCNCLAPLTKVPILCIKLVPLSLNAFSDKIITDLSSPFTVITKRNLPILLNFKVQ